MVEITETGTKKFGKPCRRCGSMRRYTSPDRCADCAQSRSREHWSKRRLAAMFAQAKSRAKAAGIPFTIKLADLSLPDVCPVLGIAMTQPSIDRRVNALGYIPGNVFLISLRANLLKRDATADEAAKVLAYMTREEGEPGLT